MDTKSQVNNENWLYEQYITNNKSIKQIGIEFNLGFTLIRSRLRKFKINGENFIEIKNNSKPQKKLTKEFLYEECVKKNKSPSELAKELKISTTSINKKLSQFTIKGKTLADIKYLNSPIGKITKQYLVKEYINNKKSIKEISEQIGVSMTTICDNLIKYGIKRRTRSESGEIARIIKKYGKEFFEHKYYIESKTMEEITEEIGTYEGCVFKIFRKLGIKSRTTKEIAEQKTIDLKGRKIGFLRVLERDIEKEKDSNHSSALWKCECVCKNIISVRSYQLTREKNNMISCGCNGKSYRDISGMYWTSKIAQAGRRGLIFNVDIDYAWNLYEKQNRKCAITGAEIFLNKNYYKNYKGQTASFDRIDSSLPYIKGNVQWVHKQVNRLKWNLTEKEFFMWCRSIYVYQSEKSTDQIEYII